MSKESLATIVQAMETGQWQRLRSVEVTKDNEGDADIGEEMVRLVKALHLWAPGLHTLRIEGNVGVRTGRLLV